MSISLFMPLVLAISIAFGACQSESPINKPSSMPNIVFDKPQAIIAGESFDVKVLAVGKLPEGVDSSGALKITLSTSQDDTSFTKVGEQDAVNGEAVFRLTLPAGSHRLRAETSGFVSWAANSDSFEVVSEAGGTSDGISFDKNSYSVAVGELFDVTVTAKKDGSALVDTEISLSLQGNGDLDGVLKAWGTNGHGVTKRTDSDGKVVFDGLFIAPLSDTKIEEISKLVATLENDDGKGTVDMAVSNVTFSISGINLRTSGSSTSILFHLDGNLDDLFKASETSLNAYFVERNGSITGSAIKTVSKADLPILSLDNESIGLLPYSCYHAAVKLGDKQAFYNRNVGNANTEMAIVNNCPQFD